MNEMRSPERSSPPPTTPPPMPSQGSPPKESLLKGAAIGWAIILGGELLTLRFLNALNILWLPPLLTVVIAVVLIFTGKSRLGAGMLLGLAAIAALILLLVAACFGLIGAFH